MNEKHASIAKITRPKISGVFPRQRLFRLLDEAREHPVIWVSGPAGSGKTTLISSYLDAKKIPCLWYQVDEGDSDNATFFNYMGLAAKKASPRNTLQIFGGKQRERLPFSGSNHPQKSKPFMKQ